LEQRQLDSAYGDEKTRIPEKFVRPAHWSGGDALGGGRADDNPQAE
jgi:hypothetical protein